MTEIIGVRFKSGGKQYYFDPNGQAVAPGQGVIIETSRGLEYGECTQGNTMVEDEAVVQPLRPLVRLATQKDLDTVAKNREKEARAFSICQEKIAAHGLDMKLVEVEYNFEGNKILFFFTSEGRVDFRALVKDLAGVFHARIELRQIGVRDEAKMLGGLGICGKPFCCATFLDEFQPVSIKMAKTQNLSLNPTKISGTCGRLMCCLKYESEGYGCGGCMRAKKVEYIPAQNDRVIAEDGEGRVVAVHEQRRTATILMDDGKTVVAAWEDVARAESEEGAPCPHAQHRERAPRERTPREPREGRERHERPVGGKPRNERSARTERGERGGRNVRGERGERSAKNAGDRRRPQSGRRQPRRTPREGNESHE